MVKVVDTVMDNEQKLSVVMQADKKPRREKLLMAPPAERVPLLPSNFTPVVAQVIELYNQGLTYTEIQARLGLKTRNQVAGIVHRNKMKQARHAARLP